MSEVRLVVREFAQDWSGTIHGSQADRAIAALSADPVTMAELEAATARFCKPSSEWRFFSNLSPGRDAEPYDAGLVVIDLIARIVAVDSSYSSTGTDGYVLYHCGDHCSKIRLDYHLAPDWKFMDANEAWWSVGDRRRRELAMKPPLDARGVFYGKPLLEFIAKETRTAFARRDEMGANEPGQSIEAASNHLTSPIPDQVNSLFPTDEEFGTESWSRQARFASPDYETLKEIHAAWLLTPREDLEGRSPREIGQDRRDHLSWDLQDRCFQWSTMNACPPGLDESSHAFRYGGYGIHELVMYFDLVRELLRSSWEQLNVLAPSMSTPDRMESLIEGESLTQEISRLEHVRDAWLNTPNSETHGTTPRSIIDRERARIPESMSSKETLIDSDCPCCRMASESSGPWFWHYDGSHMDAEFAFDIFCQTREKWDQEQRESEEFRRRFNAEMEERERLGVASSQPDEDGSNTIWSASFSLKGQTDVPLGIRVYRVGCHLAELIVGLRAGADAGSVSPETQHQIDKLNREFDNLREILESTDSSLADALIDPVCDRFAETLANLAIDRPDLVKRCDKVTEDLETLLDPDAPEFPWA